MVTSTRRMKRWRSIAAKAICEHSGATSPEDAVLILATKLLQDVDCPPTDLEALCAKMNISAMPSADLIGNGALENDGRGFRIVYAPDLPVSRRRFTIAHELGHAVLQKASKKVFSASNELERLCDMFAAEVLLPRPHFLRSIDDEFHLSTLPQLARSFQVSVTTTAIRYAELMQVSIFEAAKHHIRWGIGIVKRGPVAQIDDALKPAVASAISGQIGRDRLYLTIDGSVRTCDVQYWPVGKTGRALILIRSSNRKIRP